MRSFVFEIGCFFCNTVVDRVCARVRYDSEVQVPAESFFQWIVERPPARLEPLDVLAKGNLIRLGNI